jgi:hypothetical protein
MRLINSNDPEVLGLIGGVVGGGSPSTSVELIRATQVPRQNADLSGLVTSVKDNSLFVGAMEQMTSHVGSNQLQQPTPSGPYVEIVVSKDTRIWRDVTPRPSPGLAGPMELHQELDPADISAITANCSVQV